MFKILNQIKKSDYRVMGDYTKLKINIEIKSAIPDEIISFLCDSTSQVTIHGGLKESESFSHHLLPDLIEDFTLFSKHESDDGRFVRVTRLDNDNWSYSCSIELKNSENKIKTFLEWVAPYTLNSDNCGSYQNEEWDNPDTVSFKNGKLYFIESIYGRYIDYERSGFGLE